MRKAENGGYAQGGPPYGWRAEGGELVADEGEQQVVKQMRDLQKAGSSLRGIVEVLNSAGIPARRGRWHVETVRRALQRELA